MKVITSVEGLDALSRRSVVASIHCVLNEPPLVIVFQRGSVDSGGDGWCTPDTAGQIDSHRVFQFLMVNQLPFELHVLWEPPEVTDLCARSSKSFPDPAMAGCGRCESERLAARKAVSGNWLDGIPTGMMICPECGNKRCPRAAWHENTCTRSNEPGQPGSSYPSADTSKMSGTP
ncbi:MAG TPA: hypothetical protein VF867_11920 [Arthrobacter sp.]